MMLQCEKPDDFVVATNKYLDLRILFGTQGCWLASLFLIFFLGSLAS